jgi:ribulose-5-phosphate 4-epimerase/fuculose-1-phosphate aldolase
VDLAGKAVDGSPAAVNVAGFVIHSAIHGARDDAHCVIHTHATAGSAVACKKDGLRYDNFYSAILYGRVAYHEFEGVTTDTAEQARLVASLGDKSVLILRNHGLLVACGSISEAFITYWTLHRACEIQAVTDAMAGDNLPVTQAVLDATPERVLPFRQGARPAGEVFDGLLRRAGIRYEDLI